MAQPVNPDAAIEALNNLARNALSLLTQLEAVTTEIARLKESEPSEGAATAGKRTGAANPDALALARDAATLIKAHSTKISLFIINEPYTATAIRKVLQELVAGPIPAIASASQLCDAARYTKIVRRDLSRRCTSVLKELGALVTLIPGDGKVLRNQQKTASMKTIGRVWAACDDVIQFCNKGVVAHLISKIEECRDTLKDVMEELKEWSEQTSSDDDEDEEESAEGEEDDANTKETNNQSADVDEAAGSLANTHISNQALVDSIMEVSQHIPRDDPDRLRERLDSCLRRLRLTVLLYQAITKRRLKTLPAFPMAAGSSAPERLNEVIPLLLQVPERFISLAIAFYQLDRAEIDRLMDQCFFDAFAASELLSRPWEGQKDEFSEWALKFQIEVKKS